MTRHLSIALLTTASLCACGSNSTKSQSSVDAGGTEDAAVDGDSSDGGGGSCGQPCKAGEACDPEDRKCKPDGSTTHVGATCARTGPDVACGTLATATCNDLTNDGFPGGYCSVEPCTTVELCPHRILVRCDGGRIRGVLEELQDRCGLPDTRLQVPADGPTRRLGRVQDGVSPREAAVRDRSRLSDQPPQVRRQGLHEIARSADRSHARTWSATTAQTLSSSARSES